MRKVQGEKAPRCSDCVKWDWQKENFGFCRANAPSPAVMAKANDYTLVWPSTGGDDFCYQFQTLKNYLETNPNAPVNQ